MIVGHHAGAKILYGYDLGHPEEWSFKEVCEYGGPVFEWYDEDEDEDFGETLERRLDECHVTGVTVVHAGYEYNRVYLCAHLQVEVDDFGSTTFEPHGMVMNTDHWDLLLRSAITAVGITPIADRPQWHLATKYG